MVQSIPKIWVPPWKIRKDWQPRALKAMLAPREHAHHAFQRSWHINGETSRSLSELDPQYPHIIVIVITMIYFKVCGWHRQGIIVQEKREY